MLQKVTQMVSTFCRYLIVDGKRPIGETGWPKQEKLEFDNYISGRLTVSRSMALSSHIESRKICGELSL